MTRQIDAVLVHPNGTIQRKTVNADRTVFNTTIGPRRMPSIVHEVVIDGIKLSAYCNDNFLAEEEPENQRASELVDPPRYMAGVLALFGPHDFDAENDLNNDDDYAGMTSCPRLSIEGG